MVASLDEGSTYEVTITEFDVGFAHDTFLLRIITFVMLTTFEVFSL